MTCLLVSIQYTNVTDGRTDGRTPHDSTCRDMQSRGKNRDLRPSRFIKEVIQDRAIVTMTE